MVWFCADDYGIAKACNDRIEDCAINGVLNKISVLPNGELTDFKQRLANAGTKISLHINLVEGHPLSNPKDIPLIVSEQGTFKYSFIGLFRLSLGIRRKELEKQLYREIREQLLFWKRQMGDGPVCLDTHQHTHMIPLIFRTLMRVIRDEQIQVETIRIPAEPLAPYILTPSLYAAYPVKGLIKQWLLILLGLVNRRELKKAKLRSPYFMGALFSGRLTEEKIRKLLPRYLKIAKKNNRDIEIALHPGYVETSETLMDGFRTGFGQFYFSPWRKKEHDTLINLQQFVESTKEGCENALY